MSGLKCLTLQFRKFSNINAKGKTLYVVQTFLYILFVKIVNYIMVAFLRYNDPGSF